MGKFKTPFSSQNTQESGPKRKPVSAAKKHHKPSSKDRKQPKDSPLHLGRVDVVTPRMKNKIKQRFAAGLAQQQSGIKQTSPGVPVPFDLSQSLSGPSQHSEPCLEESQQSEPLLEESQQSEPCLEESQQSEPLLEASQQFGEFVVNDKADTQEGHGENVQPASDDESTCTQVNDNMSTQDEFYLVFEEEFEEENETATTVANAPPATNYDEARTFEIADEEQDDCNDAVNSTRAANVTNETPRVKRKPIKKKQAREHTQSHPKAVQDGNYASEYDFDGSEKISKTSTHPTAARGHINRRNYQLKMKQDVLQTIYKMHREIAVLQQRRAELIQGNAKGGNFLQGRKGKTTLPLQMILPRPLLEE